MLIKYIPSVTYWHSAYGPRVTYYYKCYRKAGEDITLITLHDKGKTITVDLDLDTTDKEIILLITKGHSSAYAMWAAMKKRRQANDKGMPILEEEKRYVMTYKNIYKRVIKLSRLGIVEEIGHDPNTVNLHGRKDYKLTQKGALCLQDHIIAHPEDIRDIVGYMIKNQMDMREFTKLMNDRVSSTIMSGNLYRKTIGMDSFQLEWDKEGLITKFKDGTLTSQQQRKKR